MTYDPVKAHAYYERTKKLKGRDSSPAGGPLGKEGGGTLAKPKSRSKSTTEQLQSAKARVSRLKSNVSKLEGALAKAQAALSKKRQEAVKEEKESSDGKSTAEEKAASKKYRDKNQEKLAAKDRKENASSDTPSKTSSDSADSVSTADLEARVTRIKGALADAKRQLSNASQQLGQLAHSAITSEPTINDQFARFRSAERTS